VSAVFGPAVIGDMQEENRLGTEYSKLVATAEVELGVKNTISPGWNLLSNLRIVLPGAKHLLQNTNGGRNNADKFDSIYDKLVKVRTRIAKKLGYKILSSWVMTGCSALITMPQMWSIFASRYWTM